MFKMYFVKTANPYVFRRIDEIARTMLNANICRDATSITKKEAVYTKKTSKVNRYSRRKYPSWKEYIGFIPITKDLVTIIKPIETMIKNAKAFDIDLQIIDEVPNIELDTNLEIDLTMSTSSIDDDDDEQYYHPYYTPSLQSDILVDTTWMCTKNPMYLRIKKALKPYGFTFNDPTDTSYPLMRLPRSKQLTSTVINKMKKNLKENFNINLTFENDDDENMTQGPDTYGYGPFVETDETKNISLTFSHQAEQDRYKHIPNNVPFYNYLPDLPLPDICVSKLDYVDITIDDKIYCVTFDNMTYEYDKKHPSVIHYTCTGIRPHLGDSFDINELLEKFNHPELCKNMNVDIWTNWNGYKVDDCFYNEKDKDEIYTTSNFDYVEKYDYWYDYSFNLYFGTIISTVLMKKDKIIYENKNSDVINGTELMQPEL